MSVAQQKNPTSKIEVGSNNQEYTLIITAPLLPEVFVLWLTPLISFKEKDGDYSYGYSFGFSPNSLPNKFCKELYDTDGL